MRKLNLILVVLMVTGNVFAGVVEQIDVMAQMRKTCNQMTKANKRAICFGALENFTDQAIKEANQRAGQDLGASEEQTLNEIIDVVAQMRETCSQMTEANKRAVCYRALEKLTDQAIQDATKRLNSN